MAKFRKRLDRPFWPTPAPKAATTAPTTAATDAATDALFQHMKMTIREGLEIAAIDEFLGSPGWAENLCFPLTKIFAREIKLGNQSAYRPRIPAPRPAPPKKGIGDWTGLLTLLAETKKKNTGSSDGGYFCSKVQMREKVELSAFNFSEKGAELGPTGFEDFPSSPKSPLSPQKPWQTKEKNRDFSQGDKEGMFTIGQAFDLLGTKGGSGGWGDGAATSKDDGWNTGDLSSERTSWPGFANPKDGGSSDAGGGWGNANKDSSWNSGPSNAGGNSDAGGGRSDRGGFGGRGRGRRDFNGGNDNNGGSSWNSGGDGTNNQAGGWSSQNSGWSLSHDNQASRHVDIANSSGEDTSAWEEA